MKKLIFISTIIVILLLIYFLRKKKKEKFTNVGNYTQCLWQDPCNGQGTLNQDCLNSDNNIVSCTDSSAVKRLKSGKCSCSVGYAGQYCQYSSSICSNNGNPNDDGSCTCNSGYMGNTCQYIIQNCNKHGTTQSDGSCLCDNFYTGENCQYESYACSSSYCPIGQSPYLDVTENKFVCSSVLTPNPCYVDSTAFKYGTGLTFLNNLKSVSNYTMLQNTPIVITTVSFSTNGKLKFLYNSTDGIMFKDYDEIKEDYSNYIWFYRTGFQALTFYPTVLSLAKDDQAGTKKYVQWAGMNPGTPTYGTGNEYNVFWDDSIKTFRIGGDNFYGILGYSGSTLMIGSNSDNQTPFINSVIDAWYSIKVQYDSNNNPYLPFVNS